MAKLKDYCLDNPLEVISGWAKEKENPYEISVESDDDERLHEEEKHERDFESFFNTANDQYAE